MKILKQLAVILLLCFIGEAIAAILPVSFPGSVISMILLFGCFMLRIIKLEDVSDVTGFLLREMAMFFIPSGVGIITVFEIAKDSAWVIFIICVVSTILTFVSTAYTVKFVMFLMNLRKTRKERTEN